MYENISEKIQESKKIAIFGHDRIDGDCICACISMKKWILKQYPNKNIDIYTPSEAPKLFDFIIGNEKIIYWKDNKIEKDDYDLAIFLDCGAIDRIWTTYKNNKEAIENMFKINIDHHISNIWFGNINVVEANRPSSCQIVYRIMKDINPKSISPNIATTLLTGIMMDTQNFSIKPTDKDSFFVSAELMGLGARRQDIHDKLFGSKNYNDIKMMWFLLNKTKSIKYKDITCYYTYTTIDEIEEQWADNKKSEWYKWNVITMINQIKDTDFVMNLTIDETENWTKISFRSKSNFDVNKVANWVWGGWHKGASGAKLDYAINPKDIETLIKWLIDKYKITEKI